MVIVKFNQANRKYLIEIEKRVIIKTMFMIDTIWINITVNEEKKNSLWQCLEERKTLTDINKNQLYFIGKYYNFSFKIKGNNLTIMGSLHKYLNQDVITPLSKNQIIFGLKKMSVDLGLNIFKGTLVRLDFGTVISLDKPAIKYLNLFKDDISYPKFRRYPHSRSYSKKNFTALFYDKKEELKKSAPDLIFSEDLHLLKYELQFVKRFNQQFRKQKIKVASLMSNSFLIEIENKWKSEFLKISKYKCMLNQKKEFTLKELRNYFFLVGVESTVGRPQLQAMIDDMIIDNSITKDQKRFIKEYIKSIYARGVIELGDNLMIELETKILNTTMVNPNNCKQLPR